MGLFFALNRNQAYLENVFFVKGHECASLPLLANTRSLEQFGRFHVALRLTKAGRYD